MNAMLGIPLVEVSEALASVARRFSTQRKARSAFGGMGATVFIVVRVYSLDKRTAQVWLVPCAGGGCAQEWARARV